MVAVEAESCVSSRISSSISSEQCSEACRSLLACLGEVVDSRKARGVRYPLDSVLAQCIVAFLCGRQNLSQVSRFGRDHRELMKDLGFSGWRRPSVPTLSRVLGQVSVKDLQKALSSWLGALVDSDRKRARCAVAAVDGKTTRACGVHVLNVFLHDVQQVVWQVPIASKDNEISALKQSLDELFAAYPFLSVLTGDAMFAGAPLCSQLIQRGRHYLFQIKADQKNLYEKMQLIFSADLSREACSSALTGEKKRLRRGAGSVDPALG